MIRFANFCSFQSTFLDPVAHTILNGLLRGFLSLICDTANGIWVTFNNKREPFHINGPTQDRMDLFISRLRFPSAFRRPACQLNRGCASEMSLQLESVCIRHAVHGVGRLCSYAIVQRHSAPFADQHRYQDGFLKKHTRLLKFLEPLPFGHAGKPFLLVSYGCGLA